MLNRLESKVCPLCSHASLARAHCLALLQGNMHVTVSANRIAMQMAMNHHLGEMGDATFPGTRIMSCLVWCKLSQHWQCAALAPAYLASACPCTTFAKLKCRPLTQINTLVVTAVVSVLATCSRRIRHVSNIAFICPVLCDEHTPYKLGPYGVFPFAIGLLWIKTCHNEKLVLS